jgi:hypothetical protein
MSKVAIAIVIALLVPATTFAEKAWIQVRETKLRSQPFFYSPGSSTLRYGQAVDRVNVTGAWAEVRTAGSKGFLPASVLSRDQILLSSQDIGRVHADSAEVVLAGKGFSKEVEQEFKEKHADARFDLVDKVERSARVAPSEAAAFAKSGGLK